ncbi:MAG: hypothetical protein HN849_06580 [Victivallales bacterium]|nr:hypothetical protein [Victivallales bacterium]
MSEEKGRWQRWQKVAWAAPFVLLALVGVLMGLRRPWVEPVPGVRIKMTRPFVRESSLGPESAYRLLLEAVELPIGAEESLSGGGMAGPELTPATAEEQRQVWQNGWSDALEKFPIHPWPRQPPPKRKNGGAAGSGETGKDTTDISPEGPWTLAQYRDIQRLRGLYEPKFAILDRALAAPNPQVPTADSVDFLLPYLSKVRQMARWLSVSAQCKAAEGDADGAHKDIERMLDMADVICRGGCLINHLVGIACDAIAADLTWRLATRRELSMPILRELAHSFLAHADGAEPFVEAIRSEAMFTSIVPELYRKASFDFLGGSTFAVPDPLSKSAFAFAFLAGSTPTTTAANLEACYQHLVAIADKPYSAKTQGEYGKFLGETLSPRRSAIQIALSTRDPVGYILASMMIPALDQAHGKAAHRDAILRGMALFLATQAYETEHGAPPERLNQLVPEFLPRVPKDPFDGKPFRYLPGSVPGLPPKAWAVYSIGEDFTDDGGKAQSVGSPRNGRTTNPDLVWPSQDYPKPAAAQAK